MSGGDGFLTRWSRRKLGAEPEQEAPVPAAAPQPEAPSSDAAEDVLPEEELAKLPSIDELTPDSDITAFLRKGVPEVLKKAALRRMWALDPAIRDYVGDARDYAWDWNVPGDVPVCGPLLPSDDMAERIERMFSTVGKPDEDQPPEPETAVAADAPPAAVSALDSAESTALEHEEDKASESGVKDNVPVSVGQFHPDPAPAERAARAAAHAPLRRHGTAIPKLELF